MEDAKGDPVVVDWRTPVAVPFYRATWVDPQGLARRRRFAVDGRVLAGLFDEDFSDPDGRAHGSPAAAGLLPNARSGYLANAGALCLLDLATELPACLPNPQLREADSGVFPHRTWMKTSQIKDGLTRTLLFSERAVALHAYRLPTEQWWVQGGFVSTLMSASAPPNFRGYWDRDLVLQDGYGALSMHPGGVCIAFFRCIFSAV